MQVVINLRRCSLRDLREKEAWKNGGMPDNRTR
jgi:hypothetical protein